MTQPAFVPISEADQVRPARRLETPTAWSPQRPADHRTPGQPTGKGFGKPGPDQGYGLRVARALSDRFELQPGEHLDDVLLGCGLLAQRRAGAFGRAPCAHDIRWAANLWGFMETELPEPLLAERRAAFSSLAHDYVAQRALVDRVPEAALRLTPEQVTDRRTTDWRELLGG